MRVSVGGAAPVVTVQANWKVTVSVAAPVVTVQAYWRVAVSVAAPVVTYKPTGEWQYLQKCLL